MIFQRNRQVVEHWPEVLESCAAAWNQPLEKRSFQFRRSLTVPPDDLIRITYSSSSSLLENATVVLDDRARLLLAARWPGHWNDAVVVEARKQPGVIFRFGKLPKVIDDPAHPWIVRSKNSTLARTMITPELTRMIDAAWSPESWMTVWERKGEVQVFVREINTPASTERLDQLIAIMRCLIAGARTVSR